jgi:hypothetical protein
MVDVRGRRPYPADGPAWQREVKGWPQERRAEVKRRAEALKAEGHPERAAWYLAWEELWE